MPFTQIKLKPIIQYVFYCALIIIVFSILEALLYRLSFSYEVYEDAVSWYFPAGLRVVCFLFLPLRYWPALFFANALGQALHGWLFLDRERLFMWGIGNAYLRTVIYQIVPLLPIFILKLKKIPLDVTKVRAMTLILGACIFYRAAYSPLLFISDLPSKLYANISEQQRFEMMLAHVLGGGITILYILLLTFIATTLWRFRKQFWTPATATFLVQLTSILGVLIATYLIEPNVLYLLRLVAIFPLIWFAYRHGYLGCLVYAACISTLLFIHVYKVNQTTLLMTTQMYIINYIVTAFILSAFIAEHSRANKALLEKNSKLIELNHLTHTLASKVIHTQESERKSLSQELHDEVGQNLTALKMYLKLAQQEQTGLQAEHNRFLTISMNAADQIYDSVYQLMHWLRPRIIDELGLSQALQSEQLASLLHNANIHFHCQIEGDLSHLCDEQQIAIYRICQESVTNTIKHASATEFSILLRVTESSIYLTISDNGVGLSQTTHATHSGNFGLQGIKERVLLLNGHCEISGDSGFSITITLPVHQS